MDKKNKNDYSAVFVFDQGNRPKKFIKYTYVHDLYKLAMYIRSNPPKGVLFDVDFLYVNVYWRRSGTYIRRYYNIGSMPSKP